MRKFFYLMVMTIMVGAFASCSKDDEPGDYTPTYDGVTVYLNAIEKLYNEDGQPKYVATDTEGIYTAYADNAGVAYNFISGLIGNSSWDGKDVTIALGEDGESGSLKIISQNLPAGIYDEIMVDIKDYQPYTLQIVTEERFNNENSGGYSGGGVARIEADSSFSGK